MFPPKPKHNVFIELENLRINVQDKVLALYEAVEGTTTLYLSQTKVEVDVPIKEIITILKKSIGEYISLFEKENPGLMARGWISTTMDYNMHYIADNFHIDMGIWIPYRIISNKETHLYLQGDTIKLNISETELLDSYKKLELALRDKVKKQDAHFRNSMANSTFSIPGSP